MSRSSRSISLAMSSVLACAAVFGAGSPAIAAKSYRNCTALNKVYPHGVGKWGARDHTSGTPVTSFKRSNALYNANDHLDRDKDKIACEKR